VAAIVRVVHEVGLGWSCVVFSGVTWKGKGVSWFLAFGVEGSKGSWEAGRLNWVTVLPVIGWVAWLVGRGCGEDERQLVDEVGCFGWLK